MEFQKKYPSASVFGILPSLRKPQAAEKQAESPKEGWNGPGRSGRGKKGKHFRVTVKYFHKWPHVRSRLAGEAYKAGKGTMDLVDIEERKSKSRLFRRMEGGKEKPGRV